MNAVIHTEKSIYDFCLVITEQNKENRYVRFATEADLLSSYPNAIWAGRANASTREFYTREQVTA